VLGGRARVDAELESASRLGSRTGSGHSTLREGIMLGLEKVRYLAVGTLTAIIALVPVAVAQAAPGAEKLMAHPRSVMINTDTTILGRGFPANSTVTLTECGATFWIVPNEVCNTENVTTVETNKKGGFKTPFEMKLCPEGKHARQPTTVICYVGVQSFVEDTGMLKPAVKVKVTYP
jgi:hypothetical protein